ncbi:hypothetical protein RCL1_001924 [Eukaryota sp. TZLM3-RCL]
MNSDSDIDSDCSSRFFSETHEELEDLSLLPKIREAQTERGPLYAQGLLLQHRLSRYFSYKRSLHSSTDVDDVEDPTKGSTLNGSVEQEQRYIRLLADFDEAREKLFTSISDQDSLINSEMQKLGDKEEKLNDLRNTSLSLRLSLIEMLQNSGNHRKPLTQKQILAYENDLKEANLLVSEERLLHLQMQRKLCLLEGGIRTDDGPQSIDFEQVRLENHSLSEKIEERNEELTGLKKKISNTIHMINHLKQKITHIQSKNDGLRDEVKVLDEDLVSHREALTRLKQAREELRESNTQLRAKTGLVSNPMLYDDYLRREARIDELKVQVEFLRSELEVLSS